MESSAGGGDIMGPGVPLMEYGDAPATTGVKGQRPVRQARVASMSMRM